MTLELPKQFLFATDIAVRISDINYNNHLGHDSIITLIHEARVRFLNAYGFTELDIDGYGLVMTDLVVIYKAEVFYGEILTIEVTIQDFTKYGCDFIYRITNKETGAEVARAKTGVLIYDYAKRKVVTVPKSFRSAMLPDS
ncbi:MAG: thioesterase family protein [Deltaproteobacteria bacterium]